MATKKSAISIAKKTKKTDTNKNISSENINDFEIKAKKKVEELLSNIELTPQQKKQAENQISKEELGGIDWLTEQVNLLTKEKEKIKKEYLGIIMKKDKELNEIKNNLKIYFNDLLIYIHKWDGKISYEEKKFKAKMFNLFPFLKNE